ncbi:putative phosphatase [Bosea sp. LC85]|uniref:HAD family hydrolase n=1 Tax=Bosea sp. LC85 TaxID=1502851 RepID=UPI0004E34511|nr:HAD family phosphatase [Bosea sp. LC85]KFC66764.1 putative phosphatase [Bosea sp. LC85]
MFDLQNLPADIRAIIFDCDGTLVNTLPVYAEAWTQGFRTSGRDMMRDWYLGRAGHSEHALMDLFEADQDVTLDREAVIKVMRKHFLQNVASVGEVEAITAVARHNQGRLPMAVASGGSRQIVTATLEATGLMPLFDTIVTINDVVRPKPEPDLFLEAARRLGIAAADCLVFEDSPEGMEAADRAGMRCIDARPHRA